MIVLWRDYEVFFNLRESKSGSPFIISNAINPNMSILVKVYNFFFKDNIQEKPDFDLKELKENLRKAKEKESQKNKPINQKSNEKQQKPHDGNSEILREIIWRDDWTKNFRTTGNTGKQEFDGKSSSETRELKNPLLVGVKMFLADIPYIIKSNYDIDRNNCLKFSKNVQNDATKCGIRCGVVLIKFHKCPTGHAIVAFETDYGVKFFEPQTANEENIMIGYRYTTCLSGVPDDDVITRAEIFWNDGAHTIIV